LPLNNAASLADSDQASPLFRYRAFGLNICSEFECRFALAGKNGAPDVQVRLGRVPESLESAKAAGVFYQASPGLLLLNVPRVARFLVSSGNEIVVDLAPGADQDFVFLLLFGSAFGALLHQRGVLAVHGSAILTSRGAVVFAGSSGYGKSALAGTFHQRGFSVLADDVCPIDMRDIPLVLPGSPFLMLWPDAIKRLGIDEQNLRRARTGIEKYILPLGKGFVPDPMPLRAVYLLELSNSDDFSLTPIRGIQRMKALYSAVFRRQFVEGMNLANDQYIRQICEVARQTKVAVVKRPRSGFRVDELADFLAADFAL
jgi:hypothetical protein